jgi:hypothetical protein
VQFVIETVLPNVESGVVLARKIHAGDFKLGPGAKLGGVAVHPRVTSPRALHSDGSLRTDLFAFGLRARGDLSAFFAGQLVELEECE